MPSLTPGYYHSSPWQKKPKNYGLIIGIEKYQRFPKADFAKEDAGQMYAYFTKVLGIPESNIFQCYEEEATKSQLIANIKGQLPRRVEDGETLFVYYSGHGYFESKSQSHYLVPYDCDPKSIQQTAYNLEDIYKDLDGLNIKEIVVFLDACFSGTARNPKMNKVPGTKPIGSAGDLKFYSDLDKVTTLSATTANQTALSYEGTSHGRFTYFLMIGLRGDADTNEDGDITLRELHDYVSFHVSKTARDSGEQQNPTLRLPSGNHGTDSVITSITRKKED
jgi:uncharacterized caspase-like protein